MAKRYVYVYVIADEPDIENKLYNVSDTPVGVEWYLYSSRKKSSSEIEEILTKLSEDWEATLLINMDDGVITAIPPAMEIDPLEVEEVFKSIQDYLIDYTGED